MNHDPVTDMAGDAQRGDFPATAGMTSTAAKDREVAANELPAAFQVFRSALDLVSRLGLMTVLGAVGTLAITRLLGPTDYGSYASAIATAAILGAAADFGFSFMLSRDAVGSPEIHRPMLQASYEVATVWSVSLAAVLVALAFSAGLSTDRGGVLLVLAPSMAFNGLNPARAFLIITRRTRLLLLIDVVSLIVQLTASVLVAAIGLGPIAVGIVVSASSIANNIVVALVVGHGLAPGSEERFSRRLLVRRSAPLGLASILTRIYLTVDLVLLGWLVSGPRLGDYAAASKPVAVLGGVAGTVMSGALPTLSAKATLRNEVEDLARRVWHWLVVAALPIFVALALFAAPLVNLALGRQYAHAAPLLEILALAGCIGVLSNLTGNLQVVFHKNAALLWQSAVAIVFNVAGNLILVPRIGVVAAAWMTVATEAVVCLWSHISLRDDIGLARVLSVGARPAVAVVLASGVALALLQLPLLAAAVSAMTFLLVLRLIGAWPVEFGFRRWRLTRS